MDYFEMLLSIVIYILYSFSILILLWGVIGSAKNFVVTRIVNKTKMDVIRENNIIKNALGSYILLSLEILIAADIIATILHPSIDDIIILAATVLIRTFISFFLIREIKEANQEHYEVSLKTKDRLKES